MNKTSTISVCQAALLSLCTEEDTDKSLGRPCVPFISATRNRTHSCSPAVGMFLWRPTMSCSCSSAWSYPASLGQGNQSSATCLPVIFEQSWCSAGHMEATGFFLLSRCTSGSQAWALLPCSLGHYILQGAISDDKQVPLSIEKVPGRQENYLRNISTNPGQENQLYLASHLLIWWTFFLEDGGKLDEMKIGSASLEIACLSMSVIKMKGI